MIMLFSMMLLGFAVTQAQTKTADSTAKTVQVKAVVHYTCPMHPEVITTKPGKCPKCGMTLVKVKTEKATKKPAKATKDTSACSMTGKEDKASCCKGE
jgi:uncharacterized protein with PIN domain